MKTQNSSDLVAVTGGSGFVTSHIIQPLLDKGYEVRATLHTLKRKGIVFAALKNAEFFHFENPEFTETDLSADTGWGHAIENAEYVMHSLPAVSHCSFVRQKTIPTLGEGNREQMKKHSYLQQTAYPD